MNHRTNSRQLAASPWRSAGRKAVLALLSLAVGIIVGANVPPPTAANGQTITPAPPPFKAGDQLALPILQDIAATLEQIDGRLERLEKFVLQRQSKRTAAAMP